MRAQRPWVNAYLEALGRIVEREQEASDRPGYD
jgi:hypothetical protein